MNRPQLNQDESYLLKTLSGPPAFMTGSAHAPEGEERSALKATTTREKARPFSGRYLNSTVWDWFKHYTAIAALFMLLATVTEAATVTNANGTLSVTNAPNIISFSWDAMTADGFTIYYGTGSRAYTSVSTVGPTNFATVNLGQKTTNSVTWFFAVTATVSGIESDFSAEVQYTPALRPPPVTNPRPPLKLAVQEKTSLSDFAWSDTGMAWDVSPGASGSFYRLVISNAPTAILASRNRPARRVPSPPLPGQ